MWNKFDDLIEEGRLISSKEVLLELKKRDDDLFDWANERQQIFIDIEDDALQVKMAYLLGTYPRLVDTRKNRSGADPFVIGVAAVHTPNLIVVTQEGATGKIDKPHIPDVCNAENIECINILELITREDWVLG